MTLIVNEIYLMDGVKNTFIIASADRQITFDSAKTRKDKHRSRKKLFPIEYLNSCLSFWGAEDLQEGKVLSEWLPQFIRRENSHKTLFDFVEKLRKELNEKMNKIQLKKHASGFHFSGYNKEGIPEFMHFSNCGLDAASGNYGGMKDYYKDTAQDFLGSDAKRYGWDGINPNSFQVKNAIQLYRNGHLKVHAAVLPCINEATKFVLHNTNFKKPNYGSDDDLVKMTKQKLNFVGSFYKFWAPTEIVAGPWDIMILRPKK